MKLDRRRLLAIFAALALLLGLIWYWQNRETVPASIELKFPKQASVGQTLDVPLRISTDVPMNAAEFYFTFPQDLLEVTAIDQGGSFFALWIKDQPAFDNETGKLSLAGGLPKPGFVGKDGLVATVRFKTLRAGSGSITLDTATSRILANDGLGSKIEAAFAPISLTVTD